MSKTPASGATASGKRSAGLLLFRRRSPEAQVLLVHPGGPFWRNKDAGAWSIPKGEMDAGEDALVAARRELREEIGMEVSGAFIPLEPVRQRAGKTVIAFALEADCDVGTIRSNTFTMEWPPRSGKLQEFPEVDRAEWFALTAARDRINSAQIPLLDQVRDLIARSASRGA